MSLGLLLATGLVIAMGPSIEQVRVVAQGPTGVAVPAGSTIQVTFAQPMDRRSVEQRFVLDPPAPGRVAWRGQTLIFQPEGPLRPLTSYTVQLDSGLRDERGRTSSAPISWSFSTRAPQLVYLAGPVGQSTQLVLASSDGGGPQVLAEEPDGISVVSLAPTGDRLLYAAQRGPQRSTLWLLDLTSTTPRPLVDDAAVSVANPAWSPDGSLIVYEQRRLVAQQAALGPPRLWMAQPDGTTLGPIDSGQAVNFAPSWSPDSRRLAFVDGNAELQVVYTFASRRSEFPNSAGEPAAWAPDSAAFVYAAFENGEERRVLLRRATIASGESEALPDTSGAVSPTWSPDGRWIAFARRSDAGQSIWVLPAGGGAPQRLTGVDGAQDLLPAWSPDSAEIAFTRITPGQSSVSSAVYVVTLDGVERLVAEDAANPLWLP